MTNQQILESRNCYCPMDEKSRKDQGIPEGFCGKCSIKGCKDFGHLAHYPGPVPCTMDFCDKHYIEEFKNPISMT